MTGIQYMGVETKALQELLSINNEEGELKPDSVVTRASDSNNPLHEHFEWDNSKAAHEHRLWQARRMICQVEVFVVAEPETRTRAFVNLNTVEGRSYRTVTDVIGSPEYIDKLRTEIRHELLRVREKLEQFDAFSLAATAVGEAVSAL